jgi:flagellar basal-body rod modification protein FlgD
MSVTSITDTNSSNPNTTAGPANQLGRQDFLQLLVMQLKNQDPLNPIDDREFISQMAQLSSLEATNQLSSQVGQMAAAQQQLGALALVGREVEYSDGSGGTARGKVSGLRLGSSAPILRIDDREVPLDQVQTVL